MIIHARKKDSEKWQGKKNTVKARKRRKQKKKKEERVMNDSARTRGGVPYIYKSDKLKNERKSVSRLQKEIFAAKIEMKGMQQSEKLFRYATLLGRRA